ncbi:MAG: hypothetical protein EZS28_003244 [Streblomastix strix]|uniref:Uncharacterized protein n=1 Tax=Streblomastix strix TaxID=222440 RepID=A0A5J4X1U3_9EUKA|nr:MAG: hypothetical protein EZS28_003244 [Streblomastix strix]
MREQERKKAMDKLIDEVLALKMEIKLLREHEIELTKEIEILKKLKSGKNTQKLSLKDMKSSPDVSAEKTHVSITRESQFLSTSSQETSTNDSRKVISQKAKGGLTYLFSPDLCHQLHQSQILTKD